MEPVLMTMAQSSKNLLLIFYLYSHAVHNSAVHHNTANNCHIHPAVILSFYSQIFPVILSFYCIPHVFIFTVFYSIYNNHIILHCVTGIIKNQVVSYIFTNPLSLRSSEWSSLYAKNFSWYFQCYLVYIYAYFSKSSFTWSLKRTLALVSYYYSYFVSVSLIKHFSFIYKKYLLHHKHVWQFYFLYIRCIQTFQLLYSGWIFVWLSSRCENSCRLCT